MAGKTSEKYNTANCPFKINYDISWVTWRAHALVSSHLNLGDGKILRWSFKPETYDLHAGQTQAPVQRNSFIA